MKNTLSSYGVESEGLISEQKKNKYQEAVQTAFKHIIDNMLGHVYWKDKNGIYLGCNERQAQNLGFNSSLEVIGKTDFELFGLKNKKLAESFRETDLKLMETGQTAIVEELTRVNEQDVFMLSQKTPLRDNLGQIIGILGVSLDITARKKEEEENRQKREWAEFTLTYIIEHLPGHIYWKNKNSVYQGCNLAQARSAGFENVNDMIGKTDYDMPWGNEADLLRQSDLMVMNTKQELIREEQSKIANSKEISTFLSKKVPFLNKKGEVIGILGISFDITDRKKMEAELRQAMLAAEAASRAKSEFIANISHDLRAPLTGVVTMSDDLKDRLKGLGGEQEAIWLHESGEQILEFCNNILDSVSADNYTEQDIKEESFDLHQLIQSIVNIEMPMIKSKGLDFIVHVDQDIPSALIADKSKLYRVLFNLLSNSIKFTEKGSVGIEVKLIKNKKDKIRLRFCVIDTGIGIKFELQDQIFERFFRVNPSYKGIYKGNGLGLYIAQKYVQLLGADRIYVESEEGKGCRCFFTLSFKLDSKKDNTKIILSEEKQQNQQSIEYSFYNASKDFQSTQSTFLLDNPPLLLLIEDNKVVLLGLESMVKRAGCQFKSVDDGEKAIELIKTHRFDLIISDIGLPGISGIELSRVIRAWEKENHQEEVPIIALTGHAAQVAEPECLEAGMSKVLTKPATVEQIKSLIREFVLNKKLF